MSLVLLFRPFGGGGSPPVVPPAATTTPGGVRGKRPFFKVRLNEVQDRESTAEFLKAQLELRKPREPFSSTEDQVKARTEEIRRLLQKTLSRQKADRLAREAKAKAEAEAEARRQKEIEDYNQAVITLLMLGD